MGLEIFSGDFVAVIKRTCEEMIEEMKNMENRERIKFLNCLFHKHFDHRPFYENLTEELRKIL
ncbi:UNVERIFIED_ORG: hypothetical protein J2X74_003183 [Bacillus sp. 1751]|nr:hypothetical protein [Bacillus sp. 1751]